jgi:hypothetical protein
MLMLILMMMAIDPVTMGLAGVAAVVVVLVVATAIAVKKQ